MLWREAFGYETAHNRPELAIDRKRAVADGLLFVAERTGSAVGSVMAGDDGHRGWLYAVAVRRDCRHQGIGRSLVRHAEQALIAMDCMKINLQLADGNDAVAAFYESLSYRVARRVSMGRHIAENIPRQ